MKKKLGLIISVLVIFSISFSYNIVAVEDDNSYLYVGGSGEGNFSSINDCLNQSKSGCTIFVCKGTYNERLVINKSISLVGESKKNTIIFGNNNFFCINVQSSNVSISGFSFENVSIGVLLSDNFKNISLKNNSFLNNSNGILANENIKNITVDSNFFFNNSEGVRFYNSSNSLITNNYFLRNHNFGIVLRNKSNYNNISKNRIFFSKVGIESKYNSNNNHILNNNISSNNCGIYVSFCENLSVYDNYIYNNSNKAINFVNSGFFNISNNTIVKNNFGIYVNNCYNFSDINNNLFYGNTYDTDVKLPPPKIPGFEVTIFILFLFFSFIVFYVYLEKFRK